MNEVEALIRVLPLVEVSCRAFTENETEVRCSDLMVWQFKVKYPTLKDKEFPGLVHSQQYPFLKKQNWTVIVCDKMKQKTLFMTKIFFRGKKQEEMRVTNLENLDKEPLNEEMIEIKQKIGRTGTFEFTVIFMNDSYVGFDKEVPFFFTIKDDDPNQVLPEYEQDDVDAVKGPGLIQ